MKLLHDCIFDPFKQTKRTLWCFARLTINSVSGCCWRGTERNVWKGIRLFSWLETSRLKFGFHVFKPFLSVSFRLSRPFFIKRNWLRQMGNAITERNQNLSVLNQFSSPFAQTDRFARVNSRKALCPKARDTASSHRYLPLGTFRQRAVRGRCIADYASYILSTLKGLVKYIVDRSNGRLLQYL